MNAGEVNVLPEPRLQFAHGQFLTDPRDGLSIFGPFDLGLPSQPKTVSYGVISTPEGVQLLSEWMKILRAPILNKLSDGEHRTVEQVDVLWPPFPGFEAATGAILPPAPVWMREVNRQALDKASLHPDPHLRASGVVKLFMDELKIGTSRDEEVRVVYCVVPEFVWKRCRPKSTVARAQAIGTRPSRSAVRDALSGQGNFLENVPSEPYQYSVDFRRQLKARAMEFKVPIQILRETTLRDGEPKFGERMLSPLSDRAWNMTATTYYKAGGKPWKLATARKGVCYLGLAFKKAEQDGSNACCAAQMFLDSGDGVVFMGENGPWYSKDTHEFHLSRAAAKNLLSGALRTYSEQGGDVLTEIFIHAASEVSADEFLGYAEACPPGVKLVAVRIRHDRLGFRLFRNGTRPVLRGTFIKLSARSGYLWTSGFKERIRTYDGMEVPVPMKLEILHGDAKIETVATDVLSLTKLNYNACKLGDSLPVTVHFSDAVGEILVNNANGHPPRPNFKFYI